MDAQIPMDWISALDWYRIRSVWLQMEHIDKVSFEKFLGFILDSRNYFFSERTDSGGLKKCFGLIPNSFGLTSDGTVGSNCFKTVFEIDLGFIWFEKLFWIIAGFVRNDRQIEKVLLIAVEFDQIDFRWIAEIKPLDKKIWIDFGLIQFKFRAEERIQVDWKNALDKYRIRSLTFEKS